MSVVPSPRGNDKLIKDTDAGNSPLLVTDHKLLLPTERTLMVLPTLHALTTYSTVAQNVYFWTFGPSTESLSFSFTATT